MKSLSQIKNGTVLIYTDINTPAQTCVVINATNDPKTTEIMWLNDKNHQIDVMNYSGANPFNLNSWTIINNEATPAKKTVINSKYTHFCVSKATGKIVDAWEYPADYDKIDILDFYKMDMKDNDRAIKEYDLKLAVALFKKGINPYDAANWGNN